MQMFKKLKILFLLLAAIGSPAFAQGGYAGRPYFEEAYRLESSEPDKSIGLYKKALQSGLDAKMRSAAVWRLFHLHRNQKQYGAAWLMLPKLGSGQGTSKIRSDLMNDMLFAWKISQTALDHYLKGISALDSGSSDYSRHFSAAVAASGGNLVFHKEISDRLLEYGRNQEAYSLMRASDSSAPAAALLEADNLLQQGRTEEAEQLLRNTSLLYIPSENGQSYSAGPAASLSQNDRFTLLYLMARIYREKGNIYESTVFFRLASHYAQGEEQNRQISLAAFGLYKNGYPLQAYLLVYRLPLSSDYNMRLLSLVLKTEVADDSASWEALTAMEKELQEQKSKGNGGFLTEKALRLISSRSNR